MERPDDERQSPLELGQLSPREREIVEAALTGLSAGEIAERFSLSQATVRSHLSSSYGKLGVRGRVELLARLNGAVEHDAPSSPAPEAAIPPARPRGAPPWSRLIVAVVAVTVVLSGAVFAIWRPDLPPRTSLDNVSRLLSQHRVSQLDLSGPDLTVTTTDGQHLLVQGVSPAAFGSLRATEIAATDPSLSIAIRSGGPALLNDILVAITALLPILLAAGAVAIVLRSMRHRGPPVRLAG